MEAQTKPIIIDEVQKSLPLLASIKQVVNRNRIPGRFVLTGSANILNLPKLSDSLAGRMEIHTLWPLSQSELEHSQGNFIDKAFANATSWHSAKSSFQELVTRILLGGYPDVIKRPTANKQDSWCASYLKTLLQRDVRDLIHIERITELSVLINLLATRAGTLLNMSELSRTSGLPTTTLKRYLTLLENLYLYVSLPPWFSNHSKRVTKSPKIYLNDVKLLGYLLGSSHTGLVNNLTMLGHVIENFVVMELKKQ